MQQRNSRENRSLLQILMCISRAEVFSIQRKAQNTTIHVQKYTQSTILFESFAVLRPRGIRVMSELAQAIKGIPEFIVAECGVHVELFLGGDTDFQFVFSSFVAWISQ